MIQANNIIITPAKDEENNLPHLIKSIINQTVKPLLWVIVDDGSIDTTPMIIKEAENKHSFIKSIRLGAHPRDIGAHYAYVCKSGFDFAINFCEDKKITYNYISLIDADMKLEKQFFEKIYSAFERNSNLGIVSGGVYLEKNGKLVAENTRLDLPRGGCRIWKYKCFKETGGYQISVCPDSVSNVKSIIRNWKLLQLKNAIAIQARPTSGGDNLWAGFVNNGTYAYCLNKNPILVLMNFAHFLLKKPYYIGVAYLYGYLLALLKKIPKIADEEVKEYYWNRRLKEYLKI
jgi:glycosyltransferase involved in cell wall biosynthesis